MAFSEVQLLAFVLAPVVAGLVKGVAGFAFSLTGTSFLALFIAPSQAVTLFILPLIAIEIELLNNLSWKEFKNCSIRFRYYLGAAVAGTVVGTLVLRELPGWPLKLGIGLVTTVFAFSRLKFFDPYLSKFSDICSESGEDERVKTALGFVSGAVFGSTNVGVQFTAYLKSLGLGRARFLGVLAMIALGVSVIRIGLSWVLGLFGSLQAVYISVIMAIFSLVTVYMFTGLGDHIPRRKRELFATSLLMLIGVQLSFSALTSV